MKKFKTTSMSKSKNPTKAVTLAAPPPLILTFTDNSPVSHDFHYDFNGNDVQVIQLQRRYTDPLGNVYTVTWTNDTGGTTQSGEWIVVNQIFEYFVDPKIFDVSIKGVDGGDIKPGTYEYRADASTATGQLAWSNTIVVTES